MKIFENRPLGGGGVTCPKICSVQTLRVLVFSLISSELQIADCLFIFLYSPPEIVRVDKKNCVNISPSTSSI